MYKGQDIILLRVNKTRDTKDKFQLYQHLETKRIVRGFINSMSSLDIPVNLYVVSDEEIKEYDYTIKSHQTVFQVKENAYSNDGCITLKYATSPKYGCKKIIATNDKLLTDGWIKDNDPFKLSDHISIVTMIGLPIIPLEFIDNYVTEYNSGNIIKKIICEYLLATYVDYSDGKTYRYPDKRMKLRVNSDNLIGIKPIKKAFSLEEITVLCLSSFEAGKTTGYIFDYGEAVATNPEAYNDWEKEHLN